MTLAFKDERKKRKEEVKLKKNVARLSRTGPNLPLVEQLVFVVYRAVREVGRVRNDVEDSILRNTEPLR